MRRTEKQSVAKTQTQQNIVKSPKPKIKNGRSWEKNCWPCSRTACKGISRLSLKNRNGCHEGSETHHVILLTTPNGHGDINRTTDPKHKTSLSWGTKRHFCLAVNPCYRVVMSQACMRFFFFLTCIESSPWQAPKTMDLCVSVTSLVYSLPACSTFYVTPVTDRRHALAHQAISDNILFPLNSYQLSTLTSVNQSTNLE